jgi:NAD(P)-dependent dehydrogenase (short-subunit alcohol dehydrogenase family)
MATEMFLKLHIPVSARETCEASNKARGLATARTNVPCASVFCMIGAFLLGMASKSSHLICGKPDRMIKTGRVAVITGAAQGIGRRTAELLAERGYSLLLSDLRPAAETLKAVRGLDADVYEVVGDISDEGIVGKIATVARERWGRADVLVNNAGISLIAPAETLSAADYRRVLEINLVAPFLLAKAFATMMLQQRAGSVINVASIAGLVGVADRAAYNASKHGLIGLTRTLAGEWGGRGVRVNAVCPGWVKTEMDVADQTAGGYTDGDITGRVPMGRFASPDDIARAIAFLADPQESGFINGHALVVDGGWTADGSWETLRLRHR